MGNSFISLNVSEFACIHEEKIFRKGLDGFNETGREIHYLPYPSLRLPAKMFHKYLLAVCGLQIVRSSSCGIISDHGKKSSGRWRDIAAEDPVVRVLFTSFTAKV